MVKTVVNVPPHRRPKEEKHNAVGERRLMTSNLDWYTMFFTHVHKASQAKKQ